MLKSVTRVDAIAAIDNPHACRLKSGRNCVDANKRPYREELYPGKTRIARINHYQCRSFTDWMRKLKRGEAGTFAIDRDNVWRFSQEGRLRQFVGQIALNKNEYIDRSMLRHVEPVKRYLNHLRSISEVDVCGEGPAITSLCSTDSEFARSSRAPYRVIRALMRRLGFRAFR
jgi:hypothetical protein